MPGQGAFHETYVVSQPSVEKNAHEAVLYVVPVAGGAATRMILGARSPRAQSHPPTILTLAGVEYFPGPMSRRITEGEGNVIVSKPAAAGTAAVKEGSAGTPSRSSGQAPAAGKIRIDQDRQRGSHDCRGASAVVNGDTNELSFRNCDQVSVNGDANAVAVRGVQSVLINGNDNKLTWELAEDGSRPRITDNGRGNTVSGKR